MVRQRRTGADVGAVARELRRTAERTRLVLRPGVEPTPGRPILAARPAFERGMAVRTAGGTPEPGGTPSPVPSDLMD